MAVSCTTGLYRPALAACGEPCFAWVPPCPGFGWLPRLPGLLWESSPKLSPQLTVSVRIPARDNPGKRGSHPNRPAFARPISSLIEPGGRFRPFNTRRGIVDSRPKVVKTRSGIVDSRPEIVDCRRRNLKFPTRNRQFPTRNRSFPTRKRQLSVGSRRVLAVSWTGPCSLSDESLPPRDGWLVRNWLSLTLWVNISPMRPGRAGPRENHV